LAKEHKKKVRKCKSTSKTPEKLWFLLNGKNQKEDRENFLNIDIIKEETVSEIES